MRSSILRMVLIGVCLLWSGIAASAGEPGIHWVTTWEEASARSVQSHKPILIDFYTDWCGWCKKLDADTYSDPKVIQFVSDQFIPVKLNAEKEGRGVASFCRIRAYPTISFLDLTTHGANQPEVAGQIVGYVQAAEFIDRATKFTQPFIEYPEMNRRYQQDSRDLEAIASLVRYYHLNHDDQRATSLLTEGMQLDKNNSKGFLTQAYNAVADSYRSGNEPNKAIPLYAKVVATGKQPSDLIHARMSLANCYFDTSDVKNSAVQLKAVLAMDAASPAVKEQAQKLLTEVESVK